MAQEDYSILFGGTPGAPAATDAKPAAPTNDAASASAAPKPAPAPIAASKPTPVENDFSILFGGTPGAKTPQAASGAHPLFNFLLNQESGNRQVDDTGRPITSPKGAIGVAQVMPTTAPEAAKLAGMPYDEMRYRTDKSYNMALGNAYFNKQLDDFGDEMKALAAYNAGPGAVRNAERRAKIDGYPDAWMRFLPDETKKYVPAIMGAAQRAGIDLGDTSARSAYQPEQAARTDAYKDPYSSVVATPLRSTGQVFKDGFSSGLESSKGLAAGVGALISATMGNNPDDGYTKTLLDYAKSQSEKSSKLQGDAASFTDAIGEDGSLGRWAANAAGYLGYQMVESIATGGAGAIVGKMIGKPIVGALASSMVEKEIGKLVASGAEKTLTKNELSAVAAGTVAKKMGAASAIFANNIRQEGGSIYGDSIEEAQKTGNPMPGFGQIWMASLAAAGVDTAGELMMAKGMLGFKEGSTASSYARRAAVEVPKGMATQGGTEVAQTVIEQLGANKDPLKPENIKDTIDSGAMGAFGGSLGSLVTASHKRDAAAAAVAPAIPVNPALAAATTHAATPNSPLSRATVAGNSPESQAAQAAEQQAGQPAAPVDPSARLAELQAIADGIPPQFTPDGQPVQGTGNQGRRYFTADENAEFDHLREMKAATEGASSTAAPAVDPISDRVTQITDAMRTGGLLQQVRDAGGDTKSLLNDLATAQSKSTNASQREQAMSRVEFALGFANDIPPAGQTAAAPNANPIIAALTDPKLSPGDRQALQAAHQASQNPALPAATRANALSTAQEIVGRNAAPLSNSVEFGGIKTQAVAAPITPVVGSTEEAMREGQRQQAGADQLTDAGYTAEAAHHQQLADSANEEAATRREEAAIAARVDDVPAPKVAIPAGSGTATMRKRKATLKQLVATGLTKVERRADGFYMTSENGKRQFKLDSPADAQLARAALAEHLTAGANLANTTPTEAQAQSNNYKKGRVEFDGLKVGIENPIGSTRSGTAPDGTRWSVDMTAHYGDVTGTMAADGDAVDVYMPSHPRPGSPVFVIDQYNADGKFDETKTVLGVGTPEAATRVYDAHFSDGSGPGRRRAVTQMTMAEYKAWVNSPAARKPAEGTHGTAGSDRDTGAPGSRPPGTNHPARGMGGGSQPEVLADETDATGEDEDRADAGQPEGRDIAAGVVANKPAGDSLTVRIDGKQETLSKLSVDTLPDVDSSDRGGKARKISKKAGKLLQAVGKAFGKEVTFFDASGKNTGDGFVISNDPNNIYLNQATGITPLNVFSHELVHQLERDNPEAHAALKAVVAARMNDKAAPEMGRYYDHKDILDELTSDLGGDLMADPTFWQEVFAKIEADNGKDATGIIARMAELIYRAIDAMGVNLRPYGASALVNDMEGIRAAFRDTMAQYVQDKGISKAAMQAQILRAGQEATRSSAEQQRESNDAAERGRWAAGDRARARAWTDNPMRAFIAKHGISLDLASEWAPGLTERRQALVQGYGPIFRRNGLSIDMLAQAAVEEGFLLEPDVPALEALIDKAIRKQRVTPQYAEGVAESEMEARIARQREFEEDAEAALSAEVFTESDLIELADADIPWGAQSNTSTTDAMRSMGFTEQEIEDEIKREARAAESTSKGGSSPVENPSKSADGADPGPDRQAPSGGQLDKRSATRDITETPSFKKWFGESKVIDAEGRPLVVYHGRDGDFTEFNTNGGTGKTHGTGSFFTSSPKVADSYAYLDNPNVAPVYLSLNNPVVIDAKGRNWNSIQQSAKVDLPAIIKSDQAEEDLLAELEGRVPEQGVTRAMAARKTTIAKMFPGEFDYPDDTVSTDDLARWARSNGHDGIIIKNVKDRGPSGRFSTDEAMEPATLYVAFDKGQIKSSIGNNGDFDGANPSITKSADRTNTPEFKRWSEDAPVISSATASTHDFKSGDSVAVEGYHGTGRPDRVGAVFQKRRATSGPMAFFTSDPELASNYAEGKADTSLADEDQSYVNWFKYQPRGLRSPLSIDRAWYHLDRETQAKVAERMPDIRTNDDGEIIYEKGGGDIGSYEWNLKQTQKPYDRVGNPLVAAVETWLNSGSLFGEEGDFRQVLQLAGMPMRDVNYDNPHGTYPYVYKAWIAMQKPLVTSDMPKKVTEELNNAALKDRSRAKYADGTGADMWDKNTRTLKDWVAALNSPDGEYAWTSIPDKVTKLFESLGYDGIIDKSGKAGGAEHPVYIPFTETQVKSAIGNNGKFDPTKKNITRSAERQPEANTLKSGAPSVAFEQTKSLETQQTVSLGVPSIRPEALIEMRKRDSILKSLMKCLG